MAEGGEKSTKVKKELEVFALQFEKQSNQLVVGTGRGYRLVNYLDPSRPTVKRGLLDQSIKMIELIPKTKTLIYVTNDDPKKANFYEYSASAVVIPPLSYTQPVTAIKTSISRIAIAHKNAIHLYNNASGKFMVKLHHIILSTPNPQGLVDLSEHDFNTYLGYPSSDQKGVVEIFDCLNMKSKIKFDAHVSPIVAISFSPTGRSVATASEQGTIIRIHIVFTGECVYEFRKSVRADTINSLRFGLDSTFLSVTSSSTTIHIFKLQSRTSSTSGSSIIMDTIHRVAENYLPTELVKFLNQDRAFAIAKLPVPDMNTISMVHRIENSHYLIVATYDGLVYTYALNETEGGECRLLKAMGIEKDQILDPNEEEWVMVEKGTKSQTDKDLAL